MIPSTAWSSGASSKMMFAALPPSSSVSFLPGAGDGALDLLADLGRAREGDLVDVRVLDELGAGAAVAGDDVDDPGGKLGLAEDVAKSSAVSGVVSAGLSTTVFPAASAGRDLPREHQQREVPGDDLPGDAERPRLAVRERVLELVGPARVVEEVRRRQRQVDVARLADRLAAVERLEHGELARALLQDPRDSEEVLGALARRQVRPAVLERLARGARRRGRRPRRPPSRPRRAAPRSRGATSSSYSPARARRHSPPTNSP